jgi:CDP-glycerol glycerophosphotransferase (TagB/SpsB family)
LARAPDVRLVIKPHPAETPDVYAPLARSHANIVVAPVSADLAALLSGAAALVTMNSTVAIDGLVLGVPALVVGLPNNLSPFVDAGVMVGVEAGGAIGPQLQALLYDRQVRDGLLARAAGFAARYEMRADGRAASRAADEVLAMTRTR